MLEVRAGAHVFKGAVCVEADLCFATFAEFSAILGFECLLLPCEMFDRACHRAGSALELLALIEYPANTLFDVGEIFRCERRIEKKVVVAPVIDRRAEGELCVRANLKYRLSENVRERVAEAIKVSILSVIHEF